MWRGVQLCVYWKAGSTFLTTTVIASTFVGLAGTEQKTEYTTDKKNLEKLLEWEREGGNKTDK